ncbi:hypothetical protein F5Y07DRAFT_380646 [Xylaria sp. FL0933]|nr:hypothetical protein F5Y07DRAFT_380646 [Xylaria sp. FL0933]
MGSQLVQAQWSLNQTSDSVYGIARGVLQAATSDNVQPLALMACEQFGNTLAISRETRLRIERTVLPTPEPVALRFLKVKIGFMKHDCAVQLGSNQAGLRFLALASALISSISAWNCADALLLMLENTTSDKRLLPTTRHLADLMSSLEGRCHLSGFADVVFGYNSIIVGASTAKGYLDYRHAHHVPEPEGLAALVDACRQLQRIGNDEISSILVEARDCAAWVAAFAKWSLELQPSIQFTDGTSIICQPGSRLTIIVIAERDQLKNDITITKRSKLDSIHDLIVQSDSQPATTYRVSFNTYKSLLVDRFGDRKSAKDAVIAALPLAIKLIYGTICSAHSLNHTKRLDGNTHQFTVTLANPFPSLEIVQKAICTIFNLGQDFPFHSLASVDSFRQLPEVEHYLHLITEYSDTDENNTDDSDTDDSDTDDSDTDDNDAGRPRRPDESLWEAINAINDPPDMSSRINNFINKVSIICCAVLFLSFFDDMENLHFAPHDSHNFWANSSLYREVRQSILYGNGHIDPKDMDDQIEDLSNPRGAILSALVFSAGSNVFWPSILDDMAYRSHDTYRISYCRGRVMYKGQVYKHIWHSLPSPSPTANDPGSLAGPVTSATQNLWASVKTQWQVTASEGFLHSRLALIDRRDSKIEYGYSTPAVNVNSLPVFLVNCEHPPHRRTENLSSTLKFTYPIPERLTSLNESDQELRIYAVGGIGELQMFCLGLIAFLYRCDAKGVAAMRQRACLACCIKACEEMQINHLIL